MSTEPPRPQAPSHSRTLAPAHQKSFAVIVVAILLLIAGITFLFVRSRGPALPAPGSEQYEQVTRAFYSGLSALEVGLLDDARERFTEATALVPAEPAAWANLALARLRLGQLDEAAGPIERALALAPANADVVLLAARMEAARGRLDEAVVRLRQAVELDPESLRARFALVDELQRLGSPEADGEALVLLDEIVRRAPTNLAALIERARIAARSGDGDRLTRSRDAIAPLTSAWPPQALEQFASFERSVAEGRLEDATRATTFLRNVLAPVPAFLESLVAVRTPAELIAEPFDRFLALAPTTAEPSPADPSIAFSAEVVGGDAAGASVAVQAVSASLEAPPFVVSFDATSVRQLSESGGVWPFPSRGGVSSVPPSANALAALDWNHDFRTDLVLAGSGGVRLLLQDEKGGYADQTAQASVGAPVADDAFGAWPADIEMDGDLDIVVGATEGPPFVLRNNGDLTWRRLQPFTGLGTIRGFGWADLDRDADADAVFLDAAGALHVFTNRQAGQFARAPNVNGVAGAIALAVADIDADGTVDIIVLESAGSVRRIWWTGTDWSVAAIATWEAFGGATAGSRRLLVADLDNNGALDLIAAGGGRSRIWMARVDYSLESLLTVPEGEVFSAVDRNEDGRIDLAAIASGRPVWLTGGGGTANYHWKTVRPRAQQRAGDQRINSFGVGGEISVRSGLLVQTQLMTGTPVHFGLGSRTAIDVARIVWPNGIAQAEFGVGVDDTIVAEQRLKGSCPWVFAWDGSKMGFVTDFLWRSPLGLRINAQDTAGVTQTEDWVRIRSDQLVPRDGFFDIRITAELWETHFFDHVSLMVVDHPANTEVFVDERFAPAQPLALEVRAVAPRGRLVTARDEQGRDVTALVLERDGRHLATFELGAYQGIAQEHFVEFEFDSPVPANATLVASGWVYPTDSSINVAIGQGGGVAPSGVSLEAEDASGVWTVVSPDVGFPAGKNKTMLVDLRGATQARRLRLRTNLEVYWDSLELVEDVETPSRITRLPAVDAELRFRGYSQTTSPRGDTPETPIYERIANVTGRWRDLVGFHTRFGNVNPLLSEVDDRYVIMNAGDEMRMRFAAPPPPESGWRRDFVLIGDGWEKDGDYNTGFSETVLPLPSHNRPAYGTGGAPQNLDDDPVYLRHRSDWQEYHTRYVTPETFIRGLRGR